MSEKKTVDKRPIRDLLQEKDAFLTTSEKAYEYFLRHTKVLIAVVVVLAVCIMAAAVYVRYQKSVEMEATLAFEKALDLATSQFDDKTAGLEALEKVRTDFDGRRGARLAAFTLVNLYVVNNASDKALSLAENLLQTLKPAEVSLKPLLLSNLGGLYENGGDFQRAGTSYEALLALNPLEPALRMETLMALARVKAATGQQDKAIELYQTVITDFPLSLKAFMANAKLAELKGEAAPFPLPVSDLSALTLNPTAGDAEENATESAEAITPDAPTVEQVNDKSAETDSDEPGLSENSTAGE